MQQPMQTWMKNDVTQLKHDVRQLKNDVRQLQNDVRQLQRDVRQLPTQTWMQNALTQLSTNMTSMIARLQFNSTCNGIAQLLRSKADTLLWQKYAAGNVSQP